MTKFQKFLIALIILVIVAFGVMFIQNKKPHVTNTVNVVVNEGDALSGDVEDNNDEVVNDTGVVDTGSVESGAIDELSGAAEATGELAGEPEGQEDTDVEMTTYTDDILKFSFQYPPARSIHTEDSFGENDEINGKMILISPDSYTPTNTIWMGLKVWIGWAEGMTLDSLATRVFQSSDPSEPSNIELDRKDIVVGGVKALLLLPKNNADWVATTQGDGATVVLLQGSNSYVFTNVKAENFATFLKLLQSFKRSS